MEKVNQKKPENKRRAEVESCSSLGYLKNLRRKAKDAVGNNDRKALEEKTAVKKYDNKILDARKADVKPAYFNKHVKNDRENVSGGKKLDKEVLIDKPLKVKSERFREKRKSFLERKHRRFQAYMRLIRMRNAKKEKKNRLSGLVKMMKLSFSRGPVGQKSLPKSSNRVRGK